MSIRAYATDVIGQRKCLMNGNSLQHVHFMIINCHCVKLRLIECRTIVINTNKNKTFLKLFEKRLFLLIFKCLKCHLTNLES